MKIYATISVLFILLAHFSFAQTVSRNDIVIDEIMADPTPQAGLPDAEWIELKNISSNNINLTGFRMVKGSAQSGAFPNFTLQPDSFVIVCSSNAANALAAYGQAIAVTSFPSLNNSEDLIYIKSKENKIISAVNYTDAWYKNELKKNGGWTLEMIDPKNACGGGSNWKASTDNKGGTPGKINSVNAANPDETSPKLLRAIATDSLTLSFVFDEPLDSLKASATANYSVNEGIGNPLSAKPVLPLFDKATLQLAQPLKRDKIYTITVNNVTDCSGNAISSNNSIRTGLSSSADSFDIVINEVLFNPPPDGADYVELYNRSQKIIDLKQLYIANRNSSGRISSIQQISTENILIFPGDYFVITEDADAVKKKYIMQNPEAFVQVTSMPSYPDDKGNVIILNAQGDVIDEVSYNDKWHFELITNTEGVALERIDYNAPSVQSNFHSAATSVGYGTPGYKNSQFRTDAQLPGEVTVTPEIFSPDNDGTDDFTELNYNFPSPGFVASITIFNAEGRPVRYLQRNALCGIKGNFKWDGLNEKRQALPQGIYIFFTEIFNTAGKKRQFKNTVVLARRN